MKKMLLFLLLLFVAIITLDQAEHYFDLWTSRLPPNVMYGGAVSEF